MLPFAAAAMATFAIVWITNLFNFMDGADGLAGGMALFAFSIYAAVAAVNGAMPLAAWSLSVAGASAGFLFFNFSPARVFLGDAGSITLGFLAGAFGIWGWTADAWPVWFPFLVAAPFFLDATATILRRMFSGEPFWHAHREHYYQRLIRSGWSHKRTALCEYALMAASGGLAISMLQWSAVAQYVGLAIAAVVYVALAHIVDRRWAAFHVPASADVVEKPATTALAAGARQLRKQATAHAGGQQEGFIGAGIKHTRHRSMTTPTTSTAGSLRVTSESSRRTDGNGPQAK
jgi:hypothetical protein